MLSRIKTAIAIALALATAPAAVAAKAPSVADLDSQSRASGNRMDVAKAVGEKLFVTQWPAQIFRVYANGVGDHIVVGLGITGVKFHHPLTRRQFVDEMSQLIAQSFAASPLAEEVDIWAVVPIGVGKGVVVNGDLAKPTTRTVFTTSVPRAAASRATVANLLGRTGVYWDEDWSRIAFKEAP